MRKVEPCDWLVGVGYYRVMRSGEMVAGRQPETDDGHPLWVDGTVEITEAMKRR